MYSQERELKKLRSTVRNKARIEGCIAEVTWLWSVGVMADNGLLPPLPHLVDLIKVMPKQKLAT
jgi:hypothetical protein